MAITVISGMTVQDIEAALSEAYVYAIAARAGANTSTRNRDYGIDGSFHEIMIVNGQRVETGATINYQLKASQNCNLSGNEVVYTLKKDAYNRLVAIKNDSIIPCFLLVLHLPPDPDIWFEICEDHLLLRRCCYWLHWQITEPIQQTSVNVHIPRMQQFTPNALNMLLEEFKKGKLK